ncbi:MAG: hypothetical protein V4451_15960 [Pseudomonadota bacterium]
MTALLNWRVWAGLALALGLAFSHFTAYRSGKAAVRAEWTAEKLAQSEAARQREKAMNIANQGVDRDLQAEKKRRAAAESRLADGLRQFSETLNSPDPTTPGRANGTGGLERELLGECANHLAGLAQTADRLEGKVVGLQSYVGRVCLIK